MGYIFYLDEFEHDLTNRDLTGLMGFGSGVAELAQHLKTGE